MTLIRKNEATTHRRDGVLGRYYQLPALSGGTTVAYAEFTLEHGQRTIGERERVYYILEGSAEFMINGEKMQVFEGDLVVMPAFATYNLWPSSTVLKVLLYMELLDTSTLLK